MFTVEESIRRSYIAIDNYMEHFSAIIAHQHDPHKHIVVETEPTSLCHIVENITILQDLMTSIFRRPQSETGGRTLSNMSSIPWGSEEIRHNSEYNMLFLPQIGCVCPCNEDLSLRIEPHNQLKIIATLRSHKPTEILIDMTELVTSKIIGTLFAGDIIHIENQPPGLFESHPIEFSIVVLIATKDHTIYLHRVCSFSGKVNNINSLRSHIQLAYNTMSTKLSDITAKAYYQREEWSI